MRIGISVSEIFGPTVQGEGPVAGEPTVFVRTGGCDLRCAWCDSLHAVLPEHRGEWRSMVPEEVMDRVQALAPAPILVTLSGGNPVMQPCGPLLDVGHRLGYRFCIETQGSITARWLGNVDVVVLSPKPPSSGMTMNWQRFDRVLDAARAADLEGGRQVAIKVPVFDQADLDWVEREVAPRYLVPLYLSVGNPYPPDDPHLKDHGNRWMAEEMGEGWLRDVLLQQYEWLVGEVLKRRMRSTVLPQLHVLVHGNQRAV